jgi:protein-S-isoprenylcysteine O-methyltransferase Ste14
VITALVASALPLVDQTGPARPVAAAIWVLWAGVEVTSGRTSDASHRGDVVQDRGTRYLFVIGLGPALAGAWLVARALPGLGLPGNPWVTFTIGSVVLACGVGLRRWAIAVLGRFFTRDVMIREGHTLISTGPYRLLRHPSYTGLILAMLGYGLMLQNWLGLAVVVAGSCVAVLPRILHEEHVLEANLGDPYREFEASHKRLIPLVW